MPIQCEETSAKSCQDPYRVVGAAENEGNAHLPTTIRPLSRRAASAMALLIGCWALAVPLAFIPVVHFVAVPALLLGGIVGAFLTWRNQGVIGPADVPCPDCGKTFRLPSQRLSTVFYAECPACHQHLCFTR